MLPYNPETTDHGGGSGGYSRLVPRREGARRLGVCTRTMRRIEETNPDAPPIVWRNGRAHYRDVDFEAYLGALVTRGLDAPSKRRAGA